VALQFLAELETCEDEAEAGNSEDPGRFEGGTADVSLAALMSDQRRLEDSFNYGGNSISVAEMTVSSSCLFE